MTNPIWLSVMIYQIDQPENNEKCVLIIFQYFEGFEVLKKITNKYVHITNNNSIFSHAQFQERHKN